MTVCFRLYIESFPVFLTVHALVGVAIAQHTSNPVVGFFSGFISHFFVDSIPHGDEPDEAWSREKRINVMFQWATIDVSTMTGVFMMLWFIRPGIIDSPTIAGAFGAILPDILQLPHYFGFDNNPLMKAYIRIHHGFHFFFNKKIGLRKGLIIQGFTLIVVLFLLLR